MRQAAADAPGVELLPAGSLPVFAGEVLHLVDLVFAHRVEQILGVALVGAVAQYKAGVSQFAAVALGDAHTGDVLF